MMGSGTTGWGTTMLPHQCIAVIYKSSYGGDEVLYSQWTAQKLDADLVECKNASPVLLSKYDCAVYGGGLYAGGGANC
jgi:hypothetical protein